MTLFVIIGVGLSAVFGGIVGAVVAYLVDESLKQERGKDISDDR
jgi:hypothetical protein